MEIPFELIFVIIFFLIIVAVVIIFSLKAKEIDVSKIPEFISKLIEKIFK
jgi:hypothetical protein